MLVLSRRTDESIVIDEDIVITVLSVEGGKVKLGITAPRDITVLRQELWQAIREQERIAEHLATSPEPPAFEELRQLLVVESAEP